MAGSKHVACRNEFAAHGQYGAGPAARGMQRPQVCLSDVQRPQVCLSKLSNAPGFAKRPRSSQLLPMLFHIGLRHAVNGPAKYITIRNKKHSCTSCIINTPEAGKSSHGAREQKQRCGALRLQQSTASACSLPSPARRCGQVQAEGLQ